MDPSQIRARILDDHAELRRMLDEVEVLAIQYEQGNARVAEWLREQGKQLYDRMSEHLDLEDRVLVPALQAADPSANRGKRLASEHQEQRELLAYLLNRLGEGSMPTVLVARELRSFVGYIRYDMVHEENVLLAELAAAGVA